MSELDYQMALVLQYKYEQEQKTPKIVDKSDEELARILQEQFNQEQQIENPTQNLVYKKPKTVDSSKSLIDPSWELIDPTPNIHTLFIAFNKQFFWDTLGSVCVSWSKRMTTCAGVCSYQGRGGLCHITLSEPLLKLRPRKDLVETLLHEMIHAYLFVTSNNRDRDGHGPEFCKHMYRINKDSGTNITIYHDFHDEVRLYQQHWWRCNGPCQHRKPFFGMVKRAMNRAPGPSDRWWGEHSRTCGGTFIKVKEPEKKQTKKSSNKENIKSKTTTDIRKFIPPVNNKTIINNTLVKKSTNENQKQISPKSEYSNDFLSVRSHWSEKFNNNNKRPASTSSSSDSPVNVKKFPKLTYEPKELKTSPTTTSSTDKKSSNSPDSIAVNFVACPNCGVESLVCDLNTHLDTCLKTDSDIIDLTDSLEESITTKQCPLCNSDITLDKFDLHAEKCLMKLYDNVEAGPSAENNETVSCLACGKQIIKTFLDSHLENCMIDIFEKNDKSSSSDNNFNCPFCMKLLPDIEMKEHIDSCLKSEENLAQAFSDNDL